jgi:hypothetical protein
MQLKRSSKLRIMGVFGFIEIQSSNLNPGPSQRIQACHEQTIWDEHSICGNIMKVCIQKRKQIMLFSVTGLPPNANLPDLKDSDRQPQWDSRKAGAFQFGRQWLPDEEAPWES